MAKELPVRWLLIVTGSTLRAEEMDRPLGYFLKQKIEDALEHGSRPAGAVWMTIKCAWWPIFAGSTTSRYRAFRPFHSVARGSMPSRTAGSRKYPSHWLSASATSSRWTPSWPSRASVWGMDNASTQIAVSVFVDRFLPRFLDRCATATAHLSFDADGESQAGSDVDDDENDG